MTTNDFFLLIDDVRSYENVEHTARTSEEGRQALLDLPVTHLLLDNDLGPEQDEGHQILQWALDSECLPKFVLLVTANVVARKRMEGMLFQAEYKFNRRNGWWEKI